jgi:hypothetical protein
MTLALMAAILVVTIHGTILPVNSGFAKAVHLTQTGINIETP